MLCLMANVCGNLSFGSKLHWKKVHERTKIVLIDLHKKNGVITRAFLGVKTPTTDKPLISLSSLDVLSSTGLSLCNVFRDKSVAMTTCYRPQRSWGKVIFSQASVILLTGGGLSQWMLGYHPLRSRHPPGSRHCPPQRADTPPPNTPPQCRACWEIRSTRGRYASYWNAILFVLLICCKSHCCVKTKEKNDDRRNDADRTCWPIYLRNMLQVQKGVSCQRPLVVLRQCTYITHGSRNSLTYVRLSEAFIGTVLSCISLCLL